MLFDVESFLGRFTRSKSKNSLGGLDVGLSSLKYAFMTKISGEFAIKSCLSILLPPKSYENGVLQDVLAISSVLEEKFNTVWESLGGKEKSLYKGVSLSVPYSQVIIQVISISKKMMPHIVREKLLEVAQKSLSDPIEQFYFDYRLIGSDEKNDTYKVFFVKREIVVSKISLAESLGFFVKRVDIDLFAQKAIFDLFYSQIKSKVILPDKVYVMVDLGHASTRINFIKNDEIVAQFPQISGWDQLSESLLNSFSSTMIPADIDKMKRGLLENSSYSADFFPRFSELIVSEVVQCISSFIDIDSIEHVFFTGGVLPDSLIVSDIFKKLSLPYSVSDLSSCIEIPENISEEYVGNSAAFTTAIGLSLRSFQE